MIAPTDGEQNSGELYSESTVGSCFVSPDGLLALSVTEDVDGDQLIGFHGFDWQVQASVLSEVTGLPVAQARQEFIDEVLNDNLLVAVLYQHEEIGDIWVTEDPEMDQSLLKPHEKLIFRYWSGKRKTL